MPIKTSGALQKKEIVSLYNGDVRLEFSESGHRYKIYYKGVERIGTKGVTTVIGILDKPQLLQWASNQCNETWINGLKGKTPDEVLIAKLSKEAPIAWRVKRDTAGDIGTLIHAQIEQYILAKVAKKALPGTPISPIIQESMLKFIAWEKANVQQFIESEKKLYSLKHNVAGTCDFTYVNKQGELCLGDIKTSKAIYDTFGLQLAAYKYMLEEEQKYTAPNSTDAYKHMVVVRVGKEGDEIEVKEIENYTKNAVSFLACVVLHKNLKS